MSNHLIRPKFSFQISNHYRMVAFSSQKIEDEVLQMTLKAVNEADSILKEVSEQANKMSHKNRQAAMQYVIKLRDSLKEYSKIGTEKVDSMIKDDIKNIADELSALKTTIKEVSNRLVEIAESEIDEIANSVASKEMKNLTQELEDSISRAVDEVEAMWNGLDQLSVLYTSYWSDLIEKKVQNMTGKVTYLMNTQGKLFNGTVEERLRMCQNISLTNMEASNTIQKMVELMDSLYNTTRTVDNLQSVYLDSDQNTSKIIQESKLVLSKYQKKSKKTLDTLLDDNFYFLGSAVRISAVSMSTYLKRYILTSWRISLGNAIRAFNQATSDHLLITEKYRTRFIDNVKRSLQLLKNEVQKKATLLDKNEQNRFEKLVSFDKLNVLMNNRFKNLIEVTNYQFESSLASIGEALRFRMDFMTNQILPSFPTLTIQNYLPTDICPLSMDFANNIKKWVNEADELREILSVDDNSSLATSEEEQISEGSQTLKSPEAKILSSNSGTAEDLNTNNGSSSPSMVMSPLPGARIESYPSNEKKRFKRQ